MLSGGKAVCLAFGICESRKASVHKLATAQGSFEGSRQYILSFEKTTPRKIPNETVWLKKLLLTNMIKRHFHPDDLCSLGTFDS